MDWKEMCDQIIGENLGGCRTSAEPPYCHFCESYVTDKPHTHEDGCLVRLALEMQREMPKLQQQAEMWRGLMKAFPWGIEDCDEARARGFGGVDINGGDLVDFVNGMREAYEGPFKPQDVAMTPQKIIAYREAAQRLHEVEGEVEVDDNAEVSSSNPPDGGAYVQAWVFVHEEEVDDGKADA